MNIELEACVAGSQFASLRLQVPPCILIGMRTMIDNEVVELVGKGMHSGGRLAFPRQGSLVGRSWSANP